MIKISHECPLSLMKQSRYFNDYDYALVHLFEEVPEYYDFFVQSLKQGREVLLDNSVFELGKAFDVKKYVEWIQKLKPTYYIIPDVLENQVKTLQKAKDFLNDYPTLPGQPIVVCQGKSLQEIEESYYYIDQELGIDYIAISFDYSFFKPLFPDKNKYKSMMLGRMHLMDSLESSKVINKNKKHHLLGCSLPQEFSYYITKPWVTSLDTSSPIVHGIKGVQYKRYGLEDKESQKLFELINHKLTEEQLDTVMFNIRKFKEIVNAEEN